MVAVALLFPQYDEKVTIYVPATAIVNVMLLSATYVDDVVVAVAVAVTSVFVNNVVHAATVALVATNTCPADGAALPDTTTSLPVVLN